MTDHLCDKEIVLGVSGGIAAYKAVELLRLLTRRGARVRVIMTENATRFVTPLTFAALSGRSVCSGLFGEEDREADAAIRHIEWAREADAVVIAPATANLVGKLAGGIADDALTTFALAVTVPVLICPAMNTHMYENRAVGRNIDRLEADGYRIVEPSAGSLACGTTGPGRLPEPEEILYYLDCALTPQDLNGQRILITAGPTREPIDPVRYISNHSSGKMGYALARAAARRGAAVTLVAGPTGLPVPTGVSLIGVESAAEMAEAVFAAMDTSDVIVKSAAVADYAPRERAGQKIKKSEAVMGIELVKTVDILKELGQRKTGQVLVGFAAETESLEANALAKLETKNLDLIVGNLVGLPGTGFGADNNTVTLFHRDGRREAFPNLPKDDVADLVLDRVAALAGRRS
ncbi:MAG: bifunctional phosphopantothenoylcysteine decarboxylase/phosphopantothenate--cysteine ligase CoaBC [Desulfobacterales bacterium]|nr:bifunctional phosphopantothenoylcysteine decarboxylase/phosphopantothenate--cysteine ligase CoaBC [Desulfobacterales bacterium]